MGLSKDIATNIIAHSLSENGLLRKVSAAKSPETVDALVTTGGKAALIVAGGLVGLSGVEAGLATILPNGKMKRSLLESAGNNLGRGLLVGLVGIGVILERSKSSIDSAAPVESNQIQSATALPRAEIAMLMEDADRRLRSAF